MAKKKVKVGIIGCGNISGIYLEKMCKTMKVLDVVGVADIDMERAKAKLVEYPQLKAMTVDEMLKTKDIEIIVNLTIPKAHAEVALAAVQAGKSVYNEKPLTVTRENGKKLLSLAADKGVLVGGAPDTFLGAGGQTCRKVIDDGWIGKPVAATAFMMCHGHESWHPAPEFYYKIGGGPMFDMGPYYLTALINLMGPVKRVTGSAQVTFPTRTITSEPKYGTIVDVETPTHIAGVMDFANGAVATIITSFDVWAANLPRIEIYGTMGTLSVPDPNTFGGPVRIKRQGAEEWSDLPLTHVYPENSRGMGVADMAYAILSGRRHRASGEMCYHVLDVMQCFLDASEKGKHVSPQSTCSQPAPLPMGLREGFLDE